MVLGDIEKIWQVLENHESKLKNLNWEKTFNKLFERKLSFERQKNSFYGVHLALCVDTRDPWKQNRVRYFSPIFHRAPDGLNDQRDTKIGQLDWAWPVSAMGGFDDTGLTWVPPVGSTLIIIFQNGSPNTAFYFGTTWQRSKGPENAPNWGYDIPEYNNIWKGHRKGYMLGKNDESQHLPSFNTDNYQGLDVDTSVDVDLVPDAQTKVTAPHIYGMSSPEKHRIKMDDGDPKCNRRWKRFELISSMGHLFLMKDDPYHHCGDWNNPNCQVSNVSIVPDICTASLVSVAEVPSSVIISGIAVSVTKLISVYGSYPCEQGPENCPINMSMTGPWEQMYLGVEHLCPFNSPMESIAVDSTPVGDCLGVLEGSKDFCYQFNNQGNNRYHKHKQECYPYLNNRCGLPQSGMQLLSRSGHAWVADDSVEQPRERPEWERTLNPFDMDGCTGVYLGRTFWRSSTGHVIDLNDSESSSKVRGPNNGINIMTACGNQILLSDHSKPECIAGERRGVHIKSTSNHTLDMVDDANQQCSPERDGCGKTGPWAKKAFVRLKTGYGMQLLMADSNSQTNTDQQYLQLMAPQKTNLQRGSHILHMQERAAGPGQILLRAGGDYVVYTYDKMVEVVGDANENPSDKYEYISNRKLVSVNDVYYNKAKMHCFWADDKILLLAGKDCINEDDDAGSCVFPVVVATGPIPDYVAQMTNMKASEHIFATAVPPPDDPCATIASDLD